MTVSSTTVKNSYSGDGSNDTFVYGFKIFASSDLQVIIRSATGTETTKTLTTDYTVTGVGTASGGNVVFESTAIPTATETVVLIRNVPQTQAIDYIANDPFPAETHEEGLDRATMTIQQMQEEINRSIKLSKTNTMTSTEFTIAAADRANKVLAFDSTGEISVTQELGTYKGTDTTVTTVAYIVRDIVKSTSAAQLNNVYICVGDSVVGDLLTDTDHFDLLVDAYSAASSAAAAASSATDAQTAQTAAELAETNAETAETNAETAETNAAASEANAATSETNAAASEAAAATSESNAATSESNASTSASTATTQAGIATTQAGNASTSASNASTSASNAATSESNAATSESNAATSASNAATSESNAATSESNAATSASAAAASADAFDDVYLGSKSSDPTTDNDGDPLAAGMLYYNSVSNIMRIYSGSAWENVAVSTAGFATLAGVETLTNKTLTAPKINEDVAVTSTATELNLLDGVSGLVQADLTKLAAIDSTAAELNTLDALSRGSIIYGNASAATAILTKGTVGQVLTSDGTDIAWGDAASGLEWQSSIVTAATLTAVANEGYWINTTSNACTITLPGSASVGDQIIFADYARTWGTNKIIIDSNGLNYQGEPDTYIVEYNTNGQTVNIVYSGATKGWIPISDDDVTDAPVVPPYSVDFLVIAGGGSGGRYAGGGGGAGGYRNSYSTETSGGGGSSETSLSLSPGTTYTITIGGGGSVPSSGQRGNDGTASSISGSGITTISSTGGGAGGGSGGSPTAGGAGGSGGGGGGNSGQSGGSGTANQGYDGGTGYNVVAAASGGGGGGGAAGAGTNGTSNGGTGGSALASSITGSSVDRAGGGGASGKDSGTHGPGGGGGAGVGASGGDTGGSGSDNTGSGGGGAHDGASGTGGSGVVILRMADSRLFINNNRKSNSYNRWYRNSFSFYTIQWKLHSIGDIYGTFCKIRKRKHS
jgi:hypothetical protein